MLYTECSYSSVQKILKHYGIDESSLAVLQIKIIDTPYVRKCYGRALEIEEYRQYTGDYDAKSTSSYSSVLPYEVQAVVHCDDHEPDVYFSAAKLPQGIAQAFVELCNSKLGTDEQYFILISEV